MRKLKYDRQSPRLKNYNYKNNGFYFITMCCGNRINYLGEIKNNILIKTQIGKIVEKYLLQIPIKFDFIKLDEYIIMPNHIHLILIIANKNREIINYSISTKYYSKISPKKGELGTVIRSFKSAVSNYANKNKILFKWQRNYYDHIIRNKKSLIKIRNYIRYNPKNWYRDRNNKF